MTTPPEVYKKINEWLTSHYEILQIWDDNYDTWFVVCQNEGRLYFLRIFRLGNEYALSQDNVTETEVKP